MTNRLFDALEQRFDDFDEVKDIERHGMSGGVSGFIYTYETREFFLKYEDEIEELMYTNGITYPNLLDCMSQNSTAFEISDYMNAAVWYAVEHWAQDKVITLENELSEEYALANAYWLSLGAMLYWLPEGLTPLRCFTTV